MVFRIDKADFMDDKEFIDLYWAFIRARGDLTSYLKKKTDLVFVLEEKD